MFLVNSCLGRFSAAPSLEHPFSRSYGVNLPSSLTTLLPLSLIHISLVAVLNTANIYGPREFTPNEVLTACGNWGANGLDVYKRQGEALNLRRKALVFPLRWHRLALVDRGR